jgi:hypothetical protein
MARRTATTAIMAMGLALGAAYPALAQVRPATASYGAATPARPGIRAATPPLGGPAPALGSIQLSLGGLAPPASGTLGTIGPCPTSGIPTSPASPAASAPINAASGVLPPTTVGTAFGLQSTSGACNPIVPGAAPTGTAPTDPNAAANFADGALPLDATESGGGGLSPLVTVPAPSIAAPPGSVPLNTGLQTPGPGAVAALVPVLPIPAISSSGCAGDPSCGGVP